MDGHGFSNLVPLLIWGLFIVAAIRRWSKRRPPPVPLNAIAAPAPAEPLARRRLATVPPPPRPPAPSRPALQSAPPDAQAAGAFPGLDLSLPGADASAAAVVTRRRIRTPGGGPPVGSPAWAANAIVAAEILGPPVSLRSGATLGAPHAF